MYESLTVKKCCFLLFKNTDFKGANTRDAYKRNEKIDFNYCNFVLYKENIDTLQAVNLLAKTLR